MRGFALFWVFGVLVAAVGWSAGVASLSMDVDDYLLALMQLSQRRVIGLDVTDSLQDALARARGATLQELAWDATRHAVLAERFLESQYGGRGVALDVGFGFLSDVEVSSWLDDLRSGGVLLPCPRCLDVGVADGALFAESLDSGLNVSWGPNFPYPVFGTPFLGAVFSFGDVIAVEFV